MPGSLNLPMLSSYTLAIKTHYISAFHVSIWLQMQRSSQCNNVFILLNDQDGIWSHLKPQLPPEMLEWVIPFTTREFVSLGLPIVPSRPVWRNSHRNGDYGFYLLLDVLKGSIPEHSVLLMDQDIGLINETWDHFIDALPWALCDAMMLTHKRALPSWSHYPGACRYYDPVYVGLWGFTALPFGLISELLARRREIAGQALRFCEADGVDFNALTNQQSLRYWPICEALVASELAQREMNVFQVVQREQATRQHFTVKQSSWQQDRSLAERIRCGETVLFHPLKEPTYGWGTKPS